MLGLFFPLVYGFKYTKEKIPDLSGKIAIVTGGNTGIGYETTFELVRNGAKVYLAARSEARAVEAIQKIEAAKMKGTVKWLKIDLQDLSSVKTAAKEFSAAESRLDILYLNAGIMAGPYQLTAADGIESQIQTNHVSHYLFTNLLLPKLEASSDPRVVAVSSQGHNLFTAGPNDFESLDSLNNTHGSTLKRYGQSKLANILFVKGLAQRHPKILANACHPGVILSELTRGTGASYGEWARTALDGFYYVQVLLGFFLLPPQGALTQLYLGTADEVQKKGIAGKYYVPIALEAKPSASATQVNVDKLWETTEKVLADKGFSLKL